MASIPMAQPKQRSYTGLYAAIAAIAVIALVITQFFGPTATLETPNGVAATATGEEDATDFLEIGRVLTVQDGAVASELASVTTLKAGQKLELTASPTAIEVGRTRIFAEGPGTLTITSETEVALDSGRIVAISGEGDAGFVVQAPNCTITDLGTVFTVESGPVGTSTQVLQGAVEVEYADSIHSLLPGGHLFVSTDQQTTAVDE